MTWFRGLGAVALLLLAVAGCSKDTPDVKGHGTYAPIITGISDTTGEPAVRGVPNNLNLLVTNVNGLPLTVHWAATAGTLTDSTGETAVWVPPDVIGNYSVSVSLTAQDGDASYFKTATFPMYVDNEFVRWTKSDAVQFDVAPTASNQLLYAELRNNVTGEGDIFRVTSPLGLPEQVSLNFFKAASPTPRGDEQQVALLGRGQSTDSTTIYLLPWAGADPTGATALTRANSNRQRFLAHPRFSWNGAFLMYASDTDLVTLPKLWYRDVANPVAPVPIVSNSGAANLVFNAYLPANWGPGGTSVAPPESVVTPSIYAFGFFGQQARGIFKFKTPSFADPPPTDDSPWIADTTFSEPDWSSDGKYICFAHRAVGQSQRDIYIIATNATSFAEAKQVTSGPADDAHPRFSKDGQTIFFISNRADYYGFNGIFATERRGTNLWGVRRFDLP